MCSTFNNFKFKTFSESTQTDNDTSENSSYLLFVFKTVPFQTIMHGRFLYK